MNTPYLLTIAWFSFNTYIIIANLGIKQPSYTVDWNMATFSLLFIGVSWFLGYMSK